MGVKVLLVCMTQDKCVYEVRLESAEASEQVEEHVVNSSYGDGFSAEIIERKSDSDIKGVIFVIEVHGDAYEIPVFVEGFAEIEDAEVFDADVGVGESKFA